MRVCPMKNRAKCKLCLTIIESHFEGDVCYCRCGEICVFGGPSMDMSPFGSPHFLRVDDLGNEVVVQYKSVNETKESDDAVDQEPEQLHVEDPLHYLESIFELDEQFLNKGHNQPMTRSEVMLYMRAIIKLFNGMLP